MRVWLQSLHRVLLLIFPSGGLEAPLEQEVLWGAKILYLLLILNVKFFNFGHQKPPGKKSPNPNSFNISCIEEGRAASKSPH
jgi:hypothetical protein